MVSQKKIAEYLKLGRSTVANILRDGGAQKYNEETCRAVLEAAERFGYRPNRASRSVRLGRTNIIGVIYYGSSSESSRQAFSFLSEALAEKGYDIHAVDLIWCGGDFRRALDQLVEMRVEGVIICQMTDYLAAGEIDILQRAGIPAVSMAGNEQWTFPVVFTDIAGSMRKMVNHLLEVGHRRLLLLTNRNEMRSILSRIRGFTEALEERGGAIIPCLRPDEVMQWPKAKNGSLEPSGKIVRLDYVRDFDPAYDYTLRLIEAGALPDAILCSNDQWARGVFTALLSKGLQVPGDVAVTGFDNDRLADFAPYYLTTVAQPVREQAAKALEMLETLMQGGKLDAEQVSLPCELVIRRSCGACRR
jgi:LacI family transcriptional regulator